MLPQNYSAHKRSLSLSKSPCKFDSPQQKMAIGTRDSLLLPFRYSITVIFMDGKAFGFTCQVLLFDGVIVFWDTTKGNINILRPGQNGRPFPDDIVKCIFLTENVWISLNISLKFVPKVRINNIPALVQIMAWRHPGNKPLSEPMMT